MSDDNSRDLIDYENLALNKTFAFKVWAILLLFSFIEVLLIFLLEPLLRNNFPELNPDTGPMDYYWKLNIRNFFTMTVAWTFYGAHQTSIWMVILWAQKQSKEKKLDRINKLRYIIAMACITIGFTLLHLLQTHLWYDGLAQDVPIWTSQGSVIIMLSVLIVMQNPKRGVFFGKKSKKYMRPEVAKVFMKNHPIIFSWALVYTFWFHPMDSSPALLSGFFYMGLLFIQVTVAYTRMHMNKWWVLLLESYVAIHATFVAVSQWLDFDANPPMWPMFLLGFLAMVVFIYIHGLGLKDWVKWTLIGGYIALLVFIYLPAPIGSGREVTFLFRLEFLWIPLILYLIAFIAAILAHIYLIFKNKKQL